MIMRPIEGVSHLALASVGLERGGLFAARSGTDECRAIAEYIQTTLEVGGDEPHGAGRNDIDYLNEYTYQARLG